MQPWRRSLHALGRPGIATNPDGVASLAGRIGEARRHPTADRQWQLCFGQGGTERHRLRLAERAVVSAGRGRRRRAMGGLPFIQMSIIGQTDFDLYVETIYATDRHGTAKGMVEVIL